MSDPYGSEPRPRPAQTGFRRILSALSLLAILLFIGLFAASLGILYASPVLVSEKALDRASVNTNVVVEFTKGMNRTSVEDAFYLYSDIPPPIQTVNGTFAWFSDTAVVFRPNTTLEPDTWYIAGINSTARDLQGNRLYGASNWDFKTSSKTGSPGTIPSGNTDVETTTAQSTPQIKSRSPTTLRGEIFLVTPWVIYFGYFESYPLIIWYVIVVLAITFSFLWLILREGKVTARILSYSIKKFTAPPEDTNNSLIIIAQLFLAITAFETAYVLILLLAGGTVERPDLNLPVGNLLYLLANASVYEEIIVRLLLLGLPLALVYAAIGIKPSKGLFGGSKRFNAPEIILILFSAVVFGIAHWLSGWGLWKILPTFIAGIAFGYLFVKVGFHAGILFHFANNFLTVPTLISTNNSILVLFLLIELFMLFVGVSYLMYYIKAVGIFAATKLGFAHVEKEPDAMAVRPEGRMKDAVPHLAGLPDFGYACSSCGWTEARYLGDGKFQCLRCGAGSGGDTKAQTTIHTSTQPAIVPGVTITVTVTDHPSQKDG